MTEEDIIASGKVLVSAIEQLAAKHAWTRADAVAVTLLAATEIAAKGIGPAAASRLFEQHAQAMIAEHERRAFI